MLARVRPRPARVPGPPRSLRPLLLALAASLLAAAPAPGAIDLDPIGDFDRPVFVTAPPNDAQRLLVVEQGGTIRILRNGVRLDRPFLTVPHVNESGEQGLLSIAFHPEYASNRRFYVYYNRDDSCSQGNCDIEIAEFRRSRRRPDRADADSYRRVLRIAHRDHPNHNGGQLQFGRDGLLYAATGDGGGTGDPEGNAQDLDSLLGKLLRIDPRKSDGRAYRVPSDNPFVGTDGADEIYAYGLRNPFRFSFDRRTGDLWIGDVGQSRREEVDLQAAGGGAGANYGWNVCEGELAYPSGTACVPPPNYVAPLFTLRHEDGNCSITGGYVSRDTSTPETLGKYVFADFCAGRLGAVTRDPFRRDDLGRNVDNPSSFGEDALCRLYVASLGGTVFRIESDDPSGSVGCQGNATTRRESRERRQRRRDKQEQAPPVEEEPAPEPEPSPGEELAP